MNVQRVVVYHQGPLRKELNHVTVSLLRNWSTDLVFLNTDTLSRPDYADFKLMKARGQQVMRVSGTHSPQRWLTIFEDWPSPDGSSQGIVFAEAVRDRSLTSVGISFDDKRWPSLGSLVRQTWREYCDFLVSQAPAGDHRAIVLERTELLLPVIAQLTNQGATVEQYYETLCSLVLRELPSYSKFRYRTMLELVQEWRYQKAFLRVLTLFTNPAHRAAYNEVVAQTGMSALEGERLPGFILYYRDGRWRRRPAEIKDLKSRGGPLFTSLLAAYQFIPKLPWLSHFAEWTIPSVITLQMALRLVNPILCGNSPYGHLVNRLATVLALGEPNLKLFPLYHIIPPQGGEPFDLSLWFKGPEAMLEAAAAARIVEFTDH